MTLLNALRTETSEVHTALHLHPIMLACQEKRITLSEYHHMLRAFQAPWLMLSSCISEFPIQNLKAFLKTRADTLNNDIEQLETETAPNTTKTTHLSSSQDSLLGIAYVLVGSSMGASLLRKCLHAALPDAPMRYMSMTAQESGWPLLATELGELETHTFPGACKAASDTFAFVNQQLDLPVNPIGIA